MTTRPFDWGTGTITDCVDKERELGVWREHHSRVPVTASAALTSAPVSVAVLFAVTVAVSLAPAVTAVEGMRCEVSE
jgi:hypothetical protein